LPSRETTVKHSEHYDNAMSWPKRKKNCKYAVKKRRRLFTNQGGGKGSPGEGDKLASRLEGGEHEKKAEEREVGKKNKGVSDRSGTVQAKCIHDTRTKQNEKETVKNRTKRGVGGADRWEN